MSWLKKGEEQEYPKCSFTLVLPLSAYKKLTRYVRAADTEVSGFANVELNLKTQQAEVGKIFLLKQTASGGSTVLDEETVNKFNLDCIKKGMKQLPRLWWHSHAEMDVFFSTTDDETFKETLNNDSWFIALVTNHKREMEAVFQLFNPFPMTFEMDVHVIYDHGKIPKYLEEEVRRKVKPIVPSHNYRSYFESQPKQSKQVFQLSKDPTKARRKITQLGLERRWDWTRHAYVYVDPVTGNTWLDHWELMSAGLEDDY